jgi:hypothetical protein
MGMNIKARLVVGVGALAGWALAVPPAQAERDLDTVKACDIVKPDEVAAIAGGKLLAPPPAGYSFCNYVVERHRGGTESYLLRFAGARLEEPLLDHRLAEGQGEKVGGMLDAAHLGTAPFSGGFQLLAIRHGDVAMEVNGERKEVVLEIAKRAAARLP